MGIPTPGTYPFFGYFRLGTTQPCFQHWLPASPSSRTNIQLERGSMVLGSKQPGEIISINLAMLDIKVEVIRLRIVLG